MERLIWLSIDRPLTDTEEVMLFSFAAPEKQQQLGRITHQESRQQRLLAEELARWLIGKELHVPPWELRIAIAPGGKPFLVDHPALHYNLSHTQGGVLCALSDRPVGVDVEQVRPFGDRAAVRWFTPAEQAWSGEDPLRRIILWTRKEAAAKWNGAGLPALRREDTRREPWKSRIVSRQMGRFVWSACSDLGWSSPPFVLALNRFIEDLYAAQSPCR